MMSIYNDEFFDVCKYSRTYMSMCRMTMMSIYIQGGEDP